MVIHRTAGRVELLRQHAWEARAKGCACGWTQKGAMPRGHERRNHAEHVAAILATAEPDVMAARWATSGVETDKPRWGTPEYHMALLQYVADTRPPSPAGEAQLSVTVSFLGNGDTVQEADMLERAATYFRRHPELGIGAANWAATVDADEGQVLRLTFEVIPPAVLPPW